MELKLETIIKKSDIKLEFVEYNGNWIYENKNGDLYHFERVEEIISNSFPFFDWTADRKLKLIKKHKRIYDD